MYIYTPMYYLYILQSTKDPNWFYKGSTNDIHRRLCQHNAGLVQSTAPYKPLNLIYTEGYLHEFAARQRESSIKKSGAVWGALMGRVKESLNVNV